MYSKGILIGLLFISNFLSIYGICEDENENGLITCLINKKEDFETINSNVTKIKLTFEAKSNLELSDGIIPNLRLLQELEIDFRNLRSIKKAAFINIPNLNKLKLSNSDEYEPLQKHIDNDTFLGLTNLKILDAEFIGLQFLDMDALSHLTSLETLALQHNQLKSITSKLFEELTNLKYLQLEYNDISEIGEMAFYNLSSLESLNLAGNKLTTLDVDVFLGAPNIEFLHLHNNNIEQISQKAFINLSNLKYLDISSNSISQLEKGSLISQRLLTTLHLHDNQLKHLDTNLFDNLKALDILTMHENKLSLLPSILFTNLKSIDLLNLKGNEIKTITTGAFNNLTTLIKLDLSFNSISKIEPDSFVNLKGLQRLNLDNNKLDSLPNEVFSNFDSIVSITMYGNPWICNCSLSWLKDFEMKIEDTSGTICTSSINETELFEFIKIGCIIISASHMPSVYVLVLVIILILVLIGAALAIVLCQRMRCGFWKVKNEINTESLRQKRIDLVMKISDSNRHMINDAVILKGKQNESMHVYDNTTLVFENETDDEKLISRCDKINIQESNLNDRHSYENNNALQLTNENSDILCKNTALPRPKSYHDQQQKPTKPIFMTSQSVDGTAGHQQFYNNAFDDEDDPNINKKKTLPLGMHSASSIHSIDIMYDDRTGDYRPISFFDQKDD